MLADDHSRLQEKKPGAADAWEHVWQTQNARFDIIAMGRSLYNRLFSRHLKPFLTESTEMVELGCGTASLGMLLAGTIRKYTGIDSSKTQVERTRKACAQYANMTILERDLYDATPHETYDIVWSQGLLEHFIDAADVAVKHLDYCKPGGTVVISVPRSGSYMEWWYRWSRSKILPIPWPWTDQRFYDEKSLTGIMEHVPKDRYRSYTIEKLKPFCAGIIILRIEAPIR